MAVNMPCTFRDFRDLPPPGFIISVLSLFHCRVNLAQTVALHTSRLYICMNCTFPWINTLHSIFFVNISFRSWWPNARDLILNILEKMKCHFFYTPCVSHFFAYVQFFFSPKINKKSPHNDGKGSKEVLVLLSAAQVASCLPSTAFHAWCFSHVRRRICDWNLFQMFS